MLGDNNVPVKGESFAKGSKKRLGGRRGQPMKKTRWIRGRRENGVDFITYNLQSKNNGGFEGKRQFRGKRITGEKLDGGGSSGSRFSEEEGKGNTEELRGPKRSNEFLIYRKVAPYTKRKTFYEGGTRGGIKRKKGSRFILRQIHPLMERQ